MTVQTNGAEGAGAGTQQTAGGSVENGATGGSNSQGGGSGEGEPNGANWDESTKNYIKSLRDENASRRAKAKELETKVTALSKQIGDITGGLKKVLGSDEGDEIPPEQQIAALQSSHESLEVRSAIMELALDNGISGQNYPYFQFLLGQKLEALGEDEELSEEELGHIIAEVNARGGTPRGGSSSVNAGGAAGNQPNGNGGGAVTAERFSKMTITEKSQLYAKQPELYASLMQEAREKRMIV
jgi:hypothetical protein